MTIQDDLEKAIKKTTKRFTAEKRKVERESRLSSRGYSRAVQYVRDTFIKEAVEETIEQAYMKASANNTLPAKLRQIMYALRPLVQEQTSRPFKNTTLLDYIVKYTEGHPIQTKDWDVVFDARGHLLEPHTDIFIPLGTLEVRTYLNNWTDEELSQSERMIIPHEEDTEGPINRYKHVLFVEKEGFNELWKAVNLSERYDIAIMSTKGMSVTAARMLVERLSSEGVTIFVMHDFDKSGFSILNTLRSDTDRWQYSVKPNVIDFGFGLADIKGVEREDTFYKQGKDPAINLRDSGATESEIEVLVQQREYRGWSGQRVELNAMDSGQLVKWVEGKLQQHGVKKFIPKAEVLEEAYKKMHRVSFLQKKLDRAAKSYKEDGLEIPDNLEKQVEETLKDSKLCWEDAIWKILPKIKLKGGG